jgi:hypothetical protein
LSWAALSAFSACSGSSPYLSGGAGSNFFDISAPRPKRTAISSYYPDHS